MYLKRKIYNRLLEWKSRPGHNTLEVNGARQVGKTYIINKPELFTTLPRMWLKAT